MLELEEDWAELGPNICFLRQSRTKYLQQNGVISKTGQEKKSLVSLFACFLTAIGKV